MNNKTVREHWKPILTLVVISPVLTELLTGNVPLNAIVNPLIFLFLATLGYGIPVLLLREFAVRRGFGVLGMLPLGLCYGIINEGYLAKTFFLSHHVPIDSFSQYGFVAGIEIPWALAISAWHMLFAFLFPVLITEWRFPDHQRKPWLSPSGWKLLAAIELVACLAIFFAPHKPLPAETLTHFATITAAFMVLVVAAVKMPALPTLYAAGAPKLVKFVIGILAFVALIMVPSVFAGIKLPPVLFGIYYLVAAMATYRYLARRTQISQASALLFGFGLYAAQALMGLLLGIASGSPVLTITAFAFILAFLTIAYRFLTQSNPTALSESIKITQ